MPGAEPSASARFAMTQRLLLISPVHNEEAYLELVADAVARQTRPPDLWVVVDDRSTDRTSEILAKLAERIDFLEIVNTAKLPPARPVKDRLATATEARAFNVGLGSVAWRGIHSHRQARRRHRAAAALLRAAVGRVRARPGAGPGRGRVRRPRPTRRRRRLEGGEGPVRASRTWNPEVLLARLLAGGRRHAGAPGVGHDRRDLRAHARLSHSGVSRSHRPPPPPLGKRRRHTQGPGAPRPVRVHRPFHACRG